MTYCNYVQQTQICKAPFMGTNFYWDKTKMVTNIAVLTYYYTVISPIIFFFYNVSLHIPLNINCIILYGKINAGTLSKTTVQKMTFSVKDFFSKCEQILRKVRKLQIWPHLLKKFLTENFIFSAVDQKTA